MFHEVILVGGRGIWEDDDSASFAQSLGEGAPIDVCRLAEGEDYDPLIDRYPPDPEKNPANPDNDLTFKVVKITPRRYCGPKFGLFGVGEVMPGKRGWILDRKFMTPNWKKTKKCLSSERRKVRKGFEVLMSCLCATMTKIKFDPLIGGEEPFIKLMGDIGKKYTDGPVNVDATLFDSGLLTGEYTDPDYEEQVNKIYECVLTMLDNASLTTQSGDISLTDKETFPKWPRDLSDQQASTLIRKLEEADPSLALNGKKGLADLGREKAQAILSKKFADTLEEMADEWDPEESCPCLDDLNYD